MNKMEEEILRKNLGLGVEEFERLKKEGVVPERKEQKRLSFVTTTKPITPGVKRKILSTHDLNANGKITKYTNKHLCVVKLGNAFYKKYLVYLMKNTYIYNL